MTRGKLQVTLDGSHGTVQRFLQAVADMGYTIGEQETVPGTRRVHVEVLTPYGEVDARPQYVGKPMRPAPTRRRA